LAAAQGTDQSQAQESSGSEAAPAPSGHELRGSLKDESPADRAARQAKRRERLLAGAKRLRDRAAELRKKVANGETATELPPNSKRPRRSLEEQAQRLEEQANKMEERSKNLDAEDEVRPERSALSARQRRHQIRRAHLNKRWGATLRDPDAIAELKAHAERIAKLKRIRIVAAQKSKDDPAAARATALLSKEEVRHERRMKELQAKTPGGTPTESPAAGEESK
jgi:hypothetical protein